MQEMSMVLNVVQLGVWLVLNAILPENVPSEIPDTYKSRLLSWPDEEHRGTIMTMNLLQSLKTFRACVASLLQQDFSSKQLQPLYDLCVTLRLICLARVVEQTRQSIIDLQYRENWKITNRQKDDWSKTNSPDLFERTVNEVAPLLKQLVTNSGYPGETDLLAQERLRAAVMARFERLYNSYEETLSRASRLQPREERNVSSDEKQTAANRPADLRWSGTAPQRDAPIKDRKLLIVLVFASHLSSDAFLLTSIYDLCC
uniref:Exocyst complex component 2 n=1 Tax=Romanomermis culicivorax TaxID=13658 RepID=A0A915L2K9_ROMCU